MRIASSCAILLIATGLPVVLAGDDAATFSDPFSTLEPGWGSPNDNLRVAGNKLILTPSPNTTYTQLYTGKAFRDIDFRVKVSLAKGGSDESGGAVFWAADYNNRYVAEIYGDGTFQVARRTRGRWLYPFTGGVVDAVKKGAGEVNELRIVTSGNQVNIEVNEQPVASFKGYPPEGESRIGLTGASGEQPYEWSFSDLSVRKGPAPNVPVAPQDESLLLTDNFSALDPAWGTADESIRVEGNRLILSPEPNTAYTPFYGGRLFDDCEIRAKISLVQGGPDSSAGIVFWAGNRDSYYTAFLYSDGNVGVTQKANGKLLIPIPGRVRAAVRQGLGQANELCVVTTGNAATIYVNGYLAGIVHGVAPEGGSQIGIRASSDASTYRWAFSDLSVRRAPVAAPAAQAVPTRLPPEVLSAWAAAGAQVCWFRENEFGFPVLLHENGPEQAGLPGDLPGFDIRPNFKDNQFANLPIPPTAFGMTFFKIRAEAGLKDLAHLKSLHTLILTGPSVNDAGIKGLADLTSLQTLALRCPKISDAGLQEVARLKDLRSLTLNVHGLTSAGLKQLAGLSNLRALNLSGSQVTDAGLKELVVFKNLQALNLASTNVTDAGLKDLAALKGLNELNLGVTKVTDAGVESLRKALPGCGISR